MPRIKRRQFLQFAGSTLATLGLSQLDLIQQGNRYAKVLAQSTPRKLALLVGVNTYPSPISSLRGCLTDVELQRELLVHRFGFNPKDILTVTDETEIKPTRQGILDSFKNHLIEQAKPGDVVVFHYSGHGSLVVDPDPLPKSNGVNGTMVPSDRLPADASDSSKVRDIMGRSLFLLMYALQTENVTAVLDCCHSGGGTRGNLVFRAIPSRADEGNEQASQEELEYQQQWLSQLNLTKATFQELRTKGIAKGAAFGSAQREQLAADASFDGFHAGAFTYLLTRYLWQQTSSQSLGSAFVNLQRCTKDVAKSARLEQEPIYEVKPDSKNEEKPIYFIDKPTLAAEAVVRGVKNGQVEFWLGGVSSQSLESFTQGALFALIDADGKELGEVEQTSRVGLVGYGKLKQGSRATTIPSGMLMRERVRGVPGDLKLRLGLDRSLGNDAQAARTALQAESRVEVVSVNQGEMVDYLLGRMTEESLAQARREQVTNPPPVGSVGLFTAGLSPVSDSFGRAGESMAEVANRLRSRFKALLAGRILRLVLNSDASALKVQATVAPVGVSGIPSIAQGSRGLQEKNEAIIAKAISAPQRLKPGTQIQVKVRNDETRDLYIGVLAIGSNGDIVVLFPATWDAPEEAARVTPGQELTVPPPNGEFQFIVQGPAGFSEILILASTEPLRDALKGMQQIARGRTGSRAGDPLSLNADEPVEVMGNLLNDLNELAGRAGVVLRGVQAVDTTQLAALSAMIQVVDS